MRQTGCTRHSGRCGRPKTVVLIGVELTVSSYIDVTIYLSLTTGCILFLSHGVVSRILEMIMTIIIILITI